MTDAGAEFRKTSSKKRGRPSLMSVYPAELVELVDSLGNQSTRRGKQNHYYYILGVAALPQDDPRFAWLCEDHTVRMTILSELGRIGQIHDKETVRKLALEICEARMTTRKAVRLLRQWRGVKMDASGSAAANAIITAVNNYFDTHPDATIEQMITALSTVLRRLEHSQPQTWRRQISERSNGNTFV